MIGSVVVISRHLTECPDWLSVHSAHVHARSHSRVHIHSRVHGRLVRVDTHGNIHAGMELRESSEVLRRHVLRFRNISLFVKFAHILPFFRVHVDCDVGLSCEDLPDLLELFVLQNSSFGACSQL